MDMVSVFKINKENTIFRSQAASLSLLTSAHSLPSVYGLHGNRAMATLACVVDPQEKTKDCGGWTVEGVY